MVISMQGTPSVYENASTTTAVIPYPSGITAGELLTAHISFTGATPPSNTPPSGWTLALNIDGGSAVQTSVWYKIATGSESGSETWTSTAAAGRTTGIMIRWSGVDNTTPLDVASVSAISAGAGNSVTAPSQTTVTANAKVVTTVSVNASSATDIATASGWTRETGSTGTGRRTVVFDQTFPSAGATGSTVWAQTVNFASLEMIAISLALRPAAGGPTLTTSGSLSASGTLSATASKNPAFARTGTLSTTGSLTATASILYPTVPVVTVRETSLQDMFRLDLYDKNRNWIAPVGAFLSIDGTKRFDNISDFDFTVKATHNRLSTMLTPGTRVRCRLRGEDFISGPIRGHSGNGPGVSGSFTFHVQDNFRILRNFLIYQVPGASMAAQSGAYNYTKTGSAEFVFKDIVTANIANRSVEPIIVPTNLNRGGVVTAQARMAKVYNEMFPLLESMGLGVAVTMTPAGLVVDVYEPGVFNTTLSENSRIIRKWKYRLDAPDVTHVVVGGQGIGTARTFISQTDTARQTLWGDRIEEFRDARDAELLDTYYERAAETLFDGQGGVGLEVTLAETKNFKFGGTNGLKVGQLVTAKVANGAVQVSDIMREIDFSYDVENGLKLTGKIGKITEPNALMAQTIAALGGSLAKLKASQ